MNVKANKKGIAFGKFAENDNEVDIDWDLRVRGYLRDALRSAETGTSWIYGRDIAALKNENNPGGSWLALTSSKTRNGSFETGTIFDSYYIAYTSDTDYEAGTNNCVPFKFSNDGKFTCESMIASYWFRSLGSTGWYNETYGGGIYMKDSTYVRVYDSKGFVVDGSSHLQSGLNTIGTHRFTTRWFGFYDSIGDAQNNTSRKGWMGFDGTKDLNINNEYNNGYIVLNASNSSNPGGIRLQTGTKIIYQEGPEVSSGPCFRPQASNTGEFYLGTSFAKWRVVYASNGTINTSDRNLKRDIESLNDKYIELFKRLKPVSYKRIDGDRTHVGFISQDVEESMNEVGLSAMDFAGFCKDIKKEEIITKNKIKKFNEKNEEIEIEVEQKKINDVLDENGNPVYEYSLRYEEFIALNTRMIQDLTVKIEDQKKEIDDLKAQVQELKELVLAMSKKGE